MKMDQAKRSAETRRRWKGMERDQMKFAMFWKYVPVRTCIYQYVPVCTCTYQYIQLPVPTSQYKDILVYPGMY